VAYHTQLGLLPDGLLQALSQAFPTGHDCVKIHPGVCATRTTQHAAQNSASLFVCYASHNHRQANA
jgi:hypothetical protein